MARLTQDKTAAAFDARIAALQDEGAALMDGIERRQHQLLLVQEKLNVLRSLRAELLDDATDEDE